MDESQNAQNPPVTAGLSIQFDRIRKVIRERMLTQDELASITDLTVIGGSAILRRPPSNFLQVQLAPMESLCLKKRALQVDLSVYSQDLHES